MKRIVFYIVLLYNRVLTRYIFSRLISHFGHKIQFCTCQKLNEIPNKVSLFSISFTIFSVISLADWRIKIGSRLFFRVIIMMYLLINLSHASREESCSAEGDPTYWDLGACSPPMLRVSEILFQRFPRDIFSKLIRRKMLLSCS